MRVVVVGDNCCVVMVFLLRARRIVASMAQTYYNKDLAIL